MTGILRYSILTMAKKPFDMLLVLLQMFLLITALNIAVAEYNSRTMLYEPVEKYLSHQGFWCAAELPDTDRPDLVEARLDIDKLKSLGDVDILLQHHYFGNEDSRIDAFIIQNDIFDKLVLPLSDGEHFSSNDESDLPLVYVTKNNEGIGVGSILDDGFGNKWRVAGVLTDPTYIFDYGYERDGSFESLYRSYDSEFFEGQSEFYTSVGMYERIGTKIPSCYVTDYSEAIVAFRNTVSDEEYKKAEQILKDDPLISYVGLESIDRRSKKILSDDIKRLLPAVAAFGVIVIIGIISCSVISAKTLKRKLEIFYCFGAARRDCILISALQTAIVTTLAGGLSIAGVMWFKHSPYSSDIGFVFRENNIIISAAVLTALLLISVTAPAFMIRPHAGKQSE